MPSDGCVGAGLKRTFNGCMEGSVGEGNQNQLCKNSCGREEERKCCLKSTWEGRSASVWVLKYRLHSTMVCFAFGGLKLVKKLSMGECGGD